MSYNVTITNKWLDKNTGKPKKTADLPGYIGHRDYATIASLMEPTGSYIDTVAYTQGFPNDVNPDSFTIPAQGDVAAKTCTNEDGKRVYEKSIYATNVYDGIGSVGLPPYWAETLIPMGVSFSQIRISDVAAGNEAGKRNTVTFTVEDFTAAFYFMTLAQQLKDNGIVIEVVENPAPAAE